MSSREYPGRPFTKEDLEQLGANYSVRDTSPDYNYRLRTNEPVVYNPHGFDVDQAELPPHHIEITQLSLKKLCNIIGSYFRQMFVDFAGCEMKYDPKNGNREIGSLVFNLVFEWKDGHSEPNKFNALVRYDRPAETIIDLQTRFRTLELTPEAKGFLMKYLVGIEYGTNGKPYVNWNKYQEEKDLNGRTSSGYNISSSFLVVTGIDLNKLVQDIWTDPEVKAADEKAAINAWKRKHWKQVTEVNPETKKTEVKYDPGPETDDEILSMCRVIRKYLISVKFKGYQRSGPNGRGIFSTTPISVLPNGQVQQGMTHDFDKYLVNVVVHDMGQIYHDFPYYGNYVNSSDFLLNLL